MRGWLTRLDPRDGSLTDEVYEIRADRVTVIGTGPLAHVRLPDGPALNRPGAVHATIVGTSLCPAHVRPGARKTYLVLPTWAYSPTQNRWLRLRDWHRLEPGTELCFDGVPGHSGTLRFRFNVEDCVVCADPLLERAQLPCSCKTCQICTACAGRMANQELVKGERTMSCPLCKARLSVARED